MEHVEGQDLSAFVKAHGTLSVADSVNFILQAARGLAYAHTGDVLEDLSGNNHHGKIIGAKWVPIDAPSLSP